jgi:acyl-CoA synthetase (AMP-forming)/AMP-acid ligase II
MTTRSSLAELLADPGSSAPAIVSSSPLVVVSYKALAGQIERLSGQLRSAGLKPGDRVAIVLPNSLEFLVVFLALTHARLVAAPLNPADKPDEIRFFIEDAQALAVVAEGANVAVREATAGLGLPTAIFTAKTLGDLLLAGFRDRLAKHLHIDGRFLAISSSQSEGHQ